MSKMTRVKYDPSAKMERFYQFIAEIMKGNEENAKFLQKSIGYGLSGDTKEECFFLVYGPTSRNWKTTLFDTIRHLLGTYAGAMDVSAIAKQTFVNSSGVTPHLARINGLRFILMNEPQKWIKLDDSLIKQLTGGDAVTARRLYEDVIEFKPMGKIFITTNTLSKMDDDSIFRSGRVKK